MGAAGIAAAAIRLLLPLRALDVQVEAVFPFAWVKASCMERPLSTGFSFLGRKMRIVPRWGRQTKVSKVSAELQGNQKPQELPEDYGHCHHQAKEHGAQSHGCAQGMHVDIK